MYNLGAWAWRCRLLEEREGRPAQLRHYHKDHIDAFDKLEKSYLDRHEDLDRKHAILACYQAVDDVPLQHLADQLKQVDQLEITCLAMEDEL
ncbi:uncharacterized protein LOC130135135 isoform X2 [Syzygium oleosum]|uniref:uncharacterized protein LOC130135135 isoform X2 n=1 Tax=Syzygium oleosum TaxID=219896 RepID=UPI0024B96276|nr:uncharacterized protein LOC130135135 isoform X2 [Syzygium oleosum]